MGILETFKQFSFSRFRKTHKMSMDCIELLRQENEVVFPFFLSFRVLSYKNL